MKKLIIDNDGYYYKGPRLELDPELFYFNIIGDYDFPRLTLTIEYPEDIKKFFDKSVSYSPLIYTSEVFISSLIDYFISNGVSEENACKFDYSEQGLQYWDNDLQTINFDLDSELRDELEKLDFLDSDYNE